MIAYRNVKLPSTAANTSEAETIARHLPCGDVVVMSASNSNSRGIGVATITIL